MCNSIKRLIVSVYIYIYMWSNVMAVLHLIRCKTAVTFGEVLWALYSAQKTLHVAQIVCYTWWVAYQALLLTILFICTHTVSPYSFMGSIYAHLYTQPILVCLSASAQCMTVHTAHKVMCSLNSSYWLDLYSLFYVIILLIEFMHWL